MKKFTNICKHTLAFLLFAQLGITVSALLSDPSNADWVFYLWLGTMVGVVCATSKLAKESF
jgi:hypothetical protein